MPAEQQVKAKYLNIDGKCLCGTYTGAKSKNKGDCIVSAWSEELNFSATNIKVPSKTNEINAIRLILEVLDLEEVLLSIDAIGAQADIVERIVQKQGNYLIALKNNQPKSMMATEHLFKHEKITDSITKKEEAKGKITSYQVDVISDVFLLEGLETKWA